MMYSLTYLGHRVTLPWLDLRLNFDLDLWRSNYAWFDVPWRDKHDRVTIVVLSFKTKTLSSKNHFGQIWPLTSGDLNFDLSLKMTKVVSEWFFQSFRTTFSVLFYDASAGAEIDGGVFTVQTPPPPSGGGNWKIQRLIRARVKQRHVSDAESPQQSNGTISFPVSSCKINNSQ